MHGAAAPAVPSSAVRTDARVVAAYVAIVVLGGVLRFAAARTFGPHIDEPASLQAALGARAHGLPLLPSGNLYLQGATLSWLLAPFVRDGRSALAAMEALRWPSVIGGTIAVAVACDIGRRLPAPVWVGLLGALLFAVDPIAVEWSARVRPYGLGQAVDALALWSLLRLLDTKAPREAALFVGALTFGVFTHVGILMLWPAFALAALLSHGRQLASSARWVAIGGVASLSPVVVFLLLNRMFAVTTRHDGATPGFVGDHLLGLTPSLWGIFHFFGAGTPGQVSFVAVCVLALVVLWSGRTATERTLLASCAVPVTLVTLLIRVQENRYFLPAEPALAMVVALAIGHIATAVATRLPSLLPLSSRFASYVAALLAVGGAALALWIPLKREARLFDHPPADPDYRPAIAWVDRQGGDGGDAAVISAMPPVAYLGVTDPGRVVFLAGKTEDSIRARQYTSVGDDGVRVDFWNGQLALASSSALCAALAADPPPWVVIDRVRLRVGWALGGTAAEIVRSTSNLVHEDRDVLVFRARPRNKWTPQGVRLCAPGPLP